jgi:hypothetical protein
VTVSRAAVLVLASWRYSEQTVTHRHRDMLIDSVRRADALPEHRPSAEHER